MATFDIDSITHNPNATIVINLPGVGAVVGWITQEISISGGNHWNTPEEASIVQGLNKMYGAVNSGAALVSSAANQFAGAGWNMGGAQRQITNPSLTMASYEASERFTIDIPMLFVATKSGDDVRSQTSKLYQAVYPSVGWGGAVGSIVAPLGYRHGNSKAIEGGISVRVGSWLYIPPIMVAESVNFTYSVQCIQNGTPLYSSGNIQLKAARITGHDEVRSFLGH